MIYSGIRQKLTMLVPKRRVTPYYFKNVASKRNMQKKYFESNRKCRKVSNGLTCFEGVPFPPLCDCTWCRMQGLGFKVEGLEVGSSRTVFGT